jgi:hypothetical protein
MAHSESFLPNSILIESKIFGLHISGLLILVGWVEFLLVFNANFHIYKNTKISGPAGPLRDLLYG